ncbi:MAG: hypothetical protein ABJB12_18975 [Pseudomonadota bacterium]
MNGMSSEANQLVNAGREAFAPTEADRSRLLAALTGTATISLGVAIGAGAQRSLSGIFGVAHVARLVAVALPVVAAGAYWLHVSTQRTEPVQVAQPVHQAQPAVVPRAAEPTAPMAEPGALEAPSEPSAPVSPERSVPVVETSKPGNEIRQEVALLSKAQAALSRGRPQEALAALTEHAQRFPRGALSEERAATRVRTLCALGRTREAAAELKRIETVNPTSAYLARARESCAF